VIEDDDLAFEKANAAPVAAAKADQAHSYQVIVDGMKAVRARINFINATFRHNHSPQSELVGLVGAYRVVQVLARRFLRAPDWPGHEVTDETKLLWEQQWYEQYCNAALEISKAMQTAAANGELTLRSSLTRIALDKNRLGAWLGEDIAASMAASFKEVYPKAKRTEYPASAHRPARTTYTEVVRLDTATGRWPDDIVLPPGAAYIADFANWANTEGIASFAEVMALLGDTSAEPPSASVPTGVDGGASLKPAMENLAALFDPVTVEQLEKMFPASGKWKSWSERGAKNGLREAKVQHARLNPYQAAMWFVAKKIEGWDLARCHRVLAKNLPARSKGKENMLIDGED